MPISWVQGVGTDSDGTGSLSKPVAHGNGVLVGVGWAGGSSDTVTVADDQDNEYNPVDALYSSAQGFWWCTFFLLGITNGPETILPTISGSPGFTTVFADEYTDLGALIGHVIAVYNHDASQTVSAGNLATTQAGCLIYGTGWTAGVPTGAGAGFTQRQANSYFITEDQIPASAGSTIGVTVATSASGGNAVFAGMAFSPLLPQPALLVTLGTIDSGATLIQADVSGFAAPPWAPVFVTLTTNYAVLELAGFPNRPSFTGTDTQDMGWPRTLSSGTRFQTFACEASALVAAGAAVYS